MNDQGNDRSRSPFAELSFSQQQEMWRMWRAQKLNYQDIPAHAAAPEPPDEPKAEIKAAPAIAPQPYQPPSHKNLDRVHARIASAAARASTFKPFT